MSFLKNLLGIKNINKPIFYKEFSEDNSQLRDLEELSSKVKNKYKKGLIDKDIKLLKIGLLGEKNVNYEIKNSKVPMLCFHDIRLEIGENIAQFDFIIITHKLIMVLETKQLNGDIYINEAGEFIRHIKNKDGRVLKKEGMYSPIVQNDRHVRILREVLINNGLIKTFPIISKVVISNSKSIINRSKAPAKIKKEIFKYDQITDMLNKEIKNEKREDAFEDALEKIAKFLLENNTEVSINYYKKYSLTEEDFKDETIENEEIVVETIEKYNEEINIMPINNVITHKEEVFNDEKVCAEVNKNIEVSEINTNSQEDMSESIAIKLKEFRTTMARIEKNKPYFVFNNNTLEEIVNKKPTTKEELLSISGFGPVKVEKYGEAILKIINEN